MASKPAVAKVLVFKDEAGEWRWSALSKNGKVIADSAEGYRNRSYALKMARALYPLAEIEWGAR